MTRFFLANISVRSGALPGSLSRAVVADDRFINAVLADLQVYQRCVCGFTGLSTLCFL